MDLILSTAEGWEERFVEDDLDMDLGGTNDFQLSLSYGAWTGDLTNGKRIYVPGTEYGGIIKGIKTATSTDQISVIGYCWRGYLQKRIICPPSGSAYKTVSGELNSVIGQLVTIPGFVASSVNTGVSVSYQFKRYCTLLDGLSDMLASVGYRLNIEYIQTQNSGYVEVSAKPIVNYGDEISEDTGINYSSEDYQMGVNHLILLGKGELASRTVVHLYANKNGVISQTQSIFGIDEIVEVYESSGAETQTLIEQGTERFKTLLSYKTFTADLKNNLMTDMNIGDTLTGRDYITGLLIKEPITEKIIKVENGLFTADYKIKGDKK